MDAGVGRARIHGRREHAADPGRRRHRLWQFQQRAPPGPKVGGARHRRACASRTSCFPKTNSFLGERQSLADTAEFCGRIRAGKDAQADDKFSIVARTEALISGHSMDEALRRAEAYHAAGADAILVHSKRKDAAEINGFMARWDRRCPIVIVPTMYYATPTDTFRQAGISTIIWANHLVRASISAMRETARSIAASQSLMDVEDRPDQRARNLQADRQRRAGGGERALSAGEPQRARRVCWGRRAARPWATSRRSCRNAWWTCGASRCCTGC